jgi:hypothetical protein
MSSESSQPPKLKCKFGFFNIDAEGDVAIQKVYLPLLFVAIAVSVAIVIVALNYSHPEWQTLVSRPFAWFRNLF